MRKKGNFVINGLLILFGILGVCSLGYQFIADAWRNFLFACIMINIVIIITFSISAILVRIEKIQTRNDGIF